MELAGVVSSGKWTVVRWYVDGRICFYKIIKHDSTISEPQGTDADITVIQQQVCTAIIITDRKPKNYLGLPALIYSLEVNSHYAAGRIAQARDASNTAKKLNIGGLIYGTVTIICFIVGAVIPVTVGLIVA
ncbi:uncharacterized protein [Dysidea avara]|uniref:uncharacterized protein isoform X2 n=1 Tax=Dysidea avara TaxID=196820 RepID=UPI003318C286